MKAKDIKKGSWYETTDFQIVRVEEPRPRIPGGFKCRTAGSGTVVFVEPRNIALLVPDHRIFSEEPAEPGPQ